MHTTHTLLDCPLYNSASLIVNTQTRIVLRATKELIHLLDDQDPTGTNWPTKEDQQLCFTTLINNKNPKQQPKRLLTCEHRNDDNNRDHDLLATNTTTTIFCADISFLETLYLNRNMFKMMDQSDNNIILRLNPYGIIQSVFSPCQSYKYMAGQPLMKYVLNEDIPILCKGLRQVTQYNHHNNQQDLYHHDSTAIAINKNKNNENKRVEEEDDYEGDDEFTIVTFDIRCNLSPLYQQLQQQQHESNLLYNNEEDEIIDDDDDGVNNSSWIEIEKETHFRKNSIYFHFSTIVTSTQDIICVMRPSDKYNHPSYNYLSSSNSFSPTTTINSTSTCFNNSSSSTYSSPSISTKLFPIFQSTKIKLKCILNKLQYALWDAMEKGLLMVAHYLATVMVLALQCYRLAKHPSFWLETSELALRCLVAETKSRPELNKLFSWLEWTGLKTPRKLFGFALDHGSEFFIHLALRPRINSFL